MNAPKIVSLLALILVSACASAPPSVASSPDVAAAAPVRPSPAAAKTHLSAHVKYPATRADILAACADTPEFTAGEKRWFSDNLPEGKYESADQVTAALKL